MEYWLLLALVYTIGFAVLTFESSRATDRMARSALGAGFALLAFSLLCEIALRFELQDWAVRGFYWARIGLALAWIGHGRLVAIWPSHRYSRWATWGLAAASVLALVLVILTPITRAEDWFAPGRPIYGQLGDLLATNRPLRWGALLLSLYGAGSLAVTAVIAARRGWKLALCGLCSIAGAALLLAPVYLQPQEANAAFFLMEAIAPVLLFIGAGTGLRDEQAQLSQNTSKRSTKRGRA